MTPRAALAAHALVLGALASAVNRANPNAYMDEPFHANQTRAYCDQRFDAHYHPKLTTFPGLFLIAAPVATAVDALVGSPPHEQCSILTLRALNLVPALATPCLLLALLRRLHPSETQSDLLANTALLTLLPTHYFFNFLFYTDTAATTAVLLLLVLLVPSKGSPTPGRLAVALAAALALSIRQTNAVWIAFAVAAAALRELDATGELPSATPLPAAIAALPWLLRRAAPRLVLAHIAPLTLLLGFAAFAVANGGIVLGDKSHHIPALHLAQLAYLVSYAAVLWQPRALTVDVATTLRSGLVAARASPMSALLAAAVACACVGGTMGHPFLLSDNRHVTFYVWRHILGRASRRWMLLPLHLLSGLLVVPPLWSNAGPSMTCIVCVAVSAVLVPAALLEPRYLTLPMLVLRLWSPVLRGQRNWLPPLLLSAVAALGSVVAYCRITWSWVDGSTARLMW